MGGWFSMETNLQEQAEEQQMKAAAIAEEEASYADQETDVASSLNGV